MARFCSLFSGSSGNSTYISSSGGSAVLVDAGRSCKQIFSSLRQRDIEPETIKAMLITHEHTDHTSALGTLLKKLKIPVYASAGVLQKLAYQNLLPPDQLVFAVDDGQRFFVENLEIEAFATPHDSIRSLCYRVKTPDERKIAVATDLGYITQRVHHMLTGCDLVMLESNYEKAMLSASRYPYYLKQRIASKEGHLSNDACAEELIHLVDTGSTRLVLAHLSKENNTPDNAYQTAYSTLVSAGMQENVDFLLRVAPRDEPSELMVL